MSDIEVPPPTMPQFQAAAGVQANAAALVHALCGAQYGDLEFDVGKSIRWTQWFTDTVFITDVNLGTPRYWIVNWTETYPLAFHAVTGVNYFYNTVAFRKEQWRQARAEGGLQYDPEDWVLFVDAHEGLAIDTRDPQPPNADVEPFKAYLYREIQRAEDANKARVVLPFYAFVKHDNIQTVYYPSPAFADGSLGFTTAAGPMGTPYYIPYQGMTRLIKVRILDDPAFDWSTIDTPAPPDTGRNIAIVSYGYAHWNVQDIVPPATAVEPLSATNDEGWEMRQLISLVRPVTGLPYADPWQPPSADTGAIPGPWAATDQFTPDPVIDSGPYLDPNIGTIQTPDTMNLTIDGDTRWTAKVRVVRPVPIVGPTFMSLWQQNIGGQVLYRTDQTGGNGSIWRFEEWASLGSQSSRNMAFGSDVDATFLPDGRDAYVGALIVSTDRTRFRALRSTDGGKTWAMYQEANGYVSPVDLTGRFPDAPAPLVIGPSWKGRIYSAQMEAINRARLIFSGYAGNTLTVPYNANLNVPVDVELVVRAALDNWTPSTTAALVGRFSGWISYGMRINPSGTINFIGSTTGTSHDVGGGSASAPTTTPGAMVWLKVTRAAATGLISFYWAPDALAEPTVWTAIGTTVSVPGASLYASTYGMELGGRNVGTLDMLDGRLPRAIVRNGITPMPALTATASRFVYPGYPGNYLSVPHAANQIAAGDSEIVARVSMPDWTPAAVNVVAGKNGAWVLYTQPNGTLSAYWGVGGGVFPASTAHGFVDGTTYWIKVTRVAATGLTSFFTAPDSATEPTSWTARGTVTNATGALPSSTSAIQIGAYTGTQFFTGRIARLLVRDGIAGTTVVDVNDNNASVGAATFPATIGGTVTVNQRQAARFVFPGTTGNFLSVPDAAALDLTTDFTIIVQGTFTAPVSAGTILSKRESLTTNSYRLDVLANGMLRFMVSPNGTDASQVVIQANSPITFGTRQWIAATFDADNGSSGSTARFFTSPDGVTWTPLGTAVTGTLVASIFNSASKIEIGTTTNGTQNFFVGVLERVILNNGIGAAGVPGGTTVMDINRDNATVGATSFAATAGGTVTVTQSAGVTISQGDPAYQFPIIQGTVLDITENNAGAMTGPNTFLASTGQTVTAIDSGGAPSYVAGLATLSAADAPDLTMESGYRFTWRTWVGDWANCAFAQVWGQSGSWAFYIQNGNFAMSIVPLDGSATKYRGLLIPSATTPLQGRDVTFRVTTIGPSTNIRTDTEYSLDNGVTWVGPYTGTGPWPPLALDVAQQMAMSNAPALGRTYWAQMEAIQRARLIFPGVVNNYLSISHAASFQTPGSFEVVVRASIDWTADNTFASRYATTGVGGRSFFFYMDATLPGRPRLAISQDGSAGNTGTSTTSVPFTANQAGWLKATYDAPTGTIRFYTAPDQPTEPTSWSQLGGDRTGLPTSVFPGTARLLIGRHDVSDSNPLNGRLARFILRNGVGVITPRLFFPGLVGNNLSVPDAAPLRVTGDITVVAKVSQPNWTSNAGTILSRFTGAQYNYMLQLNTGGRIIFIWSPDGTAGNAKSHTSANMTGLVDGQSVWVGVTLDVDNGASGYDLRFWQSPDNVTWTQVGATVTVAGVTSIFAGTNPLVVGQRFDAASPFLGRVERAIVRNGITAGGQPTGGTTVFDLNETNVPSALATSFAATTGGTVTVNGSVIQGTVFDVGENNAGAMVTADTFVAHTGQTVTVNQVGGYTIVKPQDDSLVWRFDPTEYPGTGLSYVDPRGRTWSMTAAGAIVPVAPPIIQPQADRVIWRFDPAERTGTGTSYTDPRGRTWTLSNAAAIVDNTVDTVPQPVTPDPSLAGLLVPLYDNVLRLNMRDGVFYEGGELGNIPLTWDDATQTWYPRNMSPQEWHDTEEWVAGVQ